MFGLPTFPKILILVAIIAAVWYFVRRGQVAKSEGGANVGGSAAKGAGGGQASAKPIEDMVQCKSCGAYFPVKSGCSCGNASH